MTVAKALTSASPPRRYADPSGESSYHATSAGAGTMPASVPQSRR